MGNKFKVNKVSVVMGLTLAAAVFTGCGDRLQSAEQACKRKYGTRGEITSSKLSACVNGIYFANDVAISKAATPLSRADVNTHGANKFTLARTEIDAIMAEALDRCVSNPNNRLNISSSYELTNICGDGINYYVAQWIGECYSEENGGERCWLRNIPENQGTTTEAYIQKQHKITGNINR